MVRSENCAARDKHSIQGRIVSAVNWAYRSEGLRSFIVFITSSASTFSSSVLHTCIDRRAQRASAVSQQTMGCWLMPHQHGAPCSAQRDAWQPTTSATKQPALKQPNHTHPRIPPNPPSPLSWSQGDTCARPGGRLHAGGRGHRAPRRCAAPVTVGVGWWVGCGWWWRFRGM